MAKTYRILKLVLLLSLFVCGFSTLLYINFIDNSSLNIGNSGNYLDIYGFHNDKILLEQMVYLDRQEHMYEMCQMYSKEHPNSDLLNTLSSDAQFLEHVLVDTKHKLLYCYVPKVACTNWKRVFMILSGLSDSTDPLSIPADVVHKRGVFYTFNNFTTAEIKYMLDTYTKFLFVRHPFERLLSAYRNKFERHYVWSTYFQSRFGRHIIKNYRQNASKKSLERGDDVTFEEFAAYLTGPKNKTTFNEHWEPIYKLCHPCLIKYDFIGKYETLYHDSDHLLKLSGILPSAFPKIRPSNTSEQLRKYFMKLSSHTITQLYNLYFMDFKMFNYNLEGFLGYEIG